MYSRTRLPFRQPLSVSNYQVPIVMHAWDTKRPQGTPQPSTSFQASRPPLTATRLRARIPHPLDHPHRVPILAACGYDEPAGEMRTTLSPETLSAHEHTNIPLTSKHIPLTNSISAFRLTVCKTVSNPTITTAGTRCASPWAHPPPPRHPPHRWSPPHRPAQCCSGCRIPTSAHPSVRLSRTTSEERDPQLTYSFPLSSLSPRSLTKTASSSSSLTRSSGSDTCVD